MYPSAIMAAGPMAMQVKAANLPLPDISTQSIFDAWQLGQIGRGGTYSASQWPHCEPIKRFSDKKALNEMSLNGLFSTG
ncbi:MAG: hypothetical protein WAL90_15615 [Desulfobacterales bacterium]